MSTEEKIELAQLIAPMIERKSWAKFLISAVVSGLSAAFAIGTWSANNSSWKNDVDRWRVQTTGVVNGHSTDIVNLKGDVIFLKAHDGIIK